VVLSEQFDKMAAVVDWLDACRSRKLEALLDCYAADASLACDCDSVRISGRAALAAYWKPRLADFAPTAFGLEEITPVADGVTLDYLNHEGKPVRIRFAFDSAGKISHMRCAPVLP
jgi:hypothetical protein